MPRSTRSTSSTSGRSRGNNVAAFFRATFEAWKDYKRSGRESFYVGYSPILVVDADKILTELPQAHFLHVVRNPWSAYADTKKRPCPCRSAITCSAGRSTSITRCFQGAVSDGSTSSRAEDVMRDSLRDTRALCGKLGLEAANRSARRPGTAHR